MMRLACVVALLGACLGHALVARRACRQRRASFSSSYGGRGVVCLSSADDADDAPVDEKEQSRVRRLFGFLKRGRTPQDPSGALDDDDDDDDDAPEAEERFGVSADENSALYASLRARMSEGGGVREGGATQFRERQRRSAQPTVSPSASPSPADVIVSFLKALREADRTASAESEVADVIAVLRRFMSPSSSMGAGFADTTQFANFVLSDFSALLDWEQYVFDGTPRLSYDKTQAYQTIRLRRAETKKWQTVKWTLSLAEQSKWSKTPKAPNSEDPAWLVDNFLISMSARN